MIPEEFIQELKYRSDIVDVVSSYVQLRHRGKTYSGLCPFHSEKTPSFHVYPDNQSFYCFGCGAGGDVVTFVRRMENLEYVEALRFLAQRAGMEMPEDVRDDGSARMKTRVLEINRETARIFYQNLISPGGQAGLRYLRERGLTDKTIRRFGLGYSMPSWDNLTNQLKAKGFTEEELLAAAVASRGKSGSVFDMFRGRVMFPIIDLRGNVIGFGGRQLGGDNGPKYLNSPDTPVFKKSRNLFALNFAKASKEKGMILCEGYMDVIAQHQAGFDNAVATLGTALTPDQCRLLSQYTDLVMLSYDSDEAGQKATKRGIELLSQIGMKIKVINIPDAKDPDEFIKKFGAQRFRMLLEGSANATEFAIARIRQKYDMETDDGRMNCLKELAAYLAELPNAIERDVYLSRIAMDAGISKEALSSQVTSIQKRQARSRRRKEDEELRVYAVKVPGSGPGGINEMQRRNNMKCAVAEDKLLAVLCKNPDYFRHISGRIGPEQFVTDLNRSIAQALFQRLRENLPVDMPSLSMYLEPEAMAQLSRILSEVSGRKFTVEETDDYISALLEHQNQRSSQEIGAMSDEEFRNYMAALTAGKK